MRAPPNVHRLSSVMSPEIVQDDQMTSLAEAFRSHDDWHCADPVDASQEETEDADPTSRGECAASRRWLPFIRTGNKVLQYSECTRG